MKKTIFYTLFSLTALLLLAQSSSLEARPHRHHHRSTHVQVGIGAGFSARETYVARRYVRPAVQPVYVVPTPYPAAAYAYTAPVYVEEVYLAPAPTYRPLLNFGGLSFSWNFFK